MKKSTVIINIVLVALLLVAISVSNRKDYFRNYTSRVDSASFLKGRLFEIKRINKMLEDDLLAQSVESFPDHSELKPL